MEWNKKNTLYFIQLIRERPIIWDATSNENKNKSKRLDAFLEISDLIGIPVKEVNAKWISLKGQFNREKKKMTGFKTGSDVAEIYVSKWFAYKEMFKIMPFNLPQDSVSNLETASLSPQTAPSPSPTPTPPPLTPTPPPPSRFTRPKIESGSIKRNRNTGLYSEATQMKTTRDRKSRTPDLDDEITAYGLYIVAQMRKFHPIAQSNLKLDIQALLCKYEIENLKYIVGSGSSVSDQSDYNSEVQNPQSTPPSNANEISEPIVLLR